MNRTTAAHVIRWIRQSRDRNRRLEALAVDPTNDLRFGVRADGLDDTARHFQAALYRDRPTLPALTLKPSPPTPEEWRTIAEAAHTIADSAHEYALALRDDRADFPAQHINRIAHYWQTAANNIKQALAAEAATPHVL